MQNESDIARVVGGALELRELLGIVAALQLPQGCIAAGMVRNAIWDVLHDREPSLHPRSDIDVIYFDAASDSVERDRHIERVLAERAPGVPWQARNQARMHARNGDPTYQSARDALRYFPETATAISARWERGEVVVDAPLGVSDLFDLVVRPTPNFEHKAALYRARLASKDWKERWPRLRFVEPPSWV